MSSTFFDTLRSWQNFYFMMGGSAATLIGLVFIAVSLGSSMITPEMQTNIDAFIRPMLTFFIIVLLASAIMLVPVSSAALLGSLLLALGVFGLAFMLNILYRFILFARSLDHSLPIRHWLWHVLLPLLSTLLIILTGLGQFFPVPADIFLALAAATVILLLAGIWRTWEMVMWIGLQHTSRK